MELLLFVSFLAGMLTVLAPCTITLLPVILGGSLAEENKNRPYIIIASLVVSIFVFTFILQIFSSVIDIPEETRRLISGGIIVLLGIFMLFPNIWSTITTKLGLTQKSDAALQEAGSKQGNLGAILTGAALGPVFTTCSPTFGYILSVIIRQDGNLLLGAANILAYSLGLAVILLMVTISGQWIVKKLKWAANPTGTFRKVLAIIFILVGIAITFSVDKRIQIALLQIEGFENFDVSILDQELLEEAAP